jgi:cell division protein FtsI (penicillin-binding protein 3)
MKVDKKERIRFRIYVVAFFFLLGLGAVFAKAYQLQILQNDDLGSIARDGYIGTTKLPSKRGTIYDREGRELALSVEVGSVFAHPKRVIDKAKTAKQLARILKKDRRKVLKLLTSKKPFVWVERRIPPDRAQRVKEANLKGVGITSEIKRYYPGKESGAHLLGFVGADNQGLEGIEKKYDSFLKGPQTGLIQRRDALGRPFSINRPILSDHRMHDLVLTIDKEIQFKAQEALRSAVKKAKAKGGNCLVVDPATGEILALAVVPEFNPNDFSKYKPSQWRNRTVTDCFEPGSTIKAFLLAACLEERVLTANTRIDCEQGKFKIGNATIHDTKEHGILSVSDIIMLSSNIGGVKMGQRLGYDRFYGYLQKFGFESRAGSDFIGQRKGFIRPIEKTREIDQATLFFGQGMTGTSLQLVMAMAAIANGGNLMRPYVVKAIVDDSGHTVEETRPKVIRRVISKKTAEKTAWILESVVSEEGTAPPASIDGFRVAGKTGTSQKVDPKTKRYSWSKYVATFAGFVPANDPRLVILVAIDEPRGIHYGGLVAGPVFRDVGKWALNYFRVNPQVRLTQKTGTKKPAKKGCSRKTNKIALSSKDGILPDFKGLGMREVLKKAHSLGLNVLVEGSGLAVKQTPGPGVSLKRANTLKIRFQPPT